MNHGFRQLADGARQLNQGLIEGSAKLRAVVWLEQQTGMNLTGTAGRGRPAKTAGHDAPEKAPQATPASPSVAPASALASGLRGASAVLSLTQGVPPWDLAGLGKAFTLVAGAGENTGSIPGARSAAPAGSSDPSVRRGA